MPFVANFSPSGLLFASPLFFSQLIHSERLILSSTAISKLLCFTPSQPGTNTKNKDASGVFHTYSFPLQAGYDMEKPFLNPIYDIVLLCVGDSLAIVFGFPRERKTPADETGNAELRLERFFTAEKFLQFFNQYFTMDAGDEGNSVSGNDTIVKMQQRLTKQMEILCFTGSQLNINSKIESGSTEFEDALLVLNSVEEFFYNNHMLSSSTLRRKKKGAPRTNNNQQSVPLNDFYANFLNAVDDDEIANERNEPLDLAGENSGVAKKKKKKLTSKMKKGTSNSVVSLIMLCCGKGKNSQAKLLSSEIRDADSFTLEDHPSSVRNSSVLSLENSVSSSVKNSNAISFLPLPLLFIYLASMVTRDELKCFLPFSSLNESVHSLFWNVRHLAEVEEENKKGKSKTKDNGNTTTTGEQGVSTLTRNNNATVLGQYSVSFFRPQMSHATVSSQGATLFSNQPTFASPHTMYRVVHLPNRLLYYFSADRVYNRQHIGEKHPEEEETGKKGAKPKQTDEKGSKTCLPAPRSRPCTTASIR
ncbi:hypothetical protein AGDE_15711 [Angomonas deanei]|uniref:Uncharacterized protein n=1 Tax=Angomonas deanei TaxID=59799 RepID=A0A7G2C8J0_9TRYP|nr:hypothetical protein AGDE_15711 [Angomonas deanei]CAD2216180.1 hypothetical protein, conserved [Angomonas deanei]|eukprot:EPY18594.1 hypothetical protein AGDE_15711 [Angomonas deanei]